MGRNASSFFSMLAKLEDDVLVSGINLNGESYSNLAKTSAKALLKFVKSGTWTDSKVFKFIALYYRESYSNLVAYWRLKYGNDKSESTFRNQKMKAGSVLETLLGSISSVESAFLTEDDEALTNLCLKIKSLSGTDISISRFVDGDLLTRIMGERDYSKTYNVSDCTAEIGFLVSICHDNINECIKTLDIQKLGYLCSVLQSPMLLNGKVNHDKMELVSKLRYGMDGSPLDMRISVANFAKSFVEESSSESDIDWEKRCEELERENLELRMQLEDSGSIENTVSIGDINIPISVYEAICSADVIDFEDTVKSADFKGFFAAIACCDSYFMRQIIERLPDKIRDSLKWYILYSDEKRREEMYDFMSNFIDTILEGDSTKYLSRYIMALNAISNGTFWKEDSQK